MSGARGTPSEDRGTLVREPARRHGCLHQLSSAAALARFAAGAPWPAADSFLLLADAVPAWPDRAASLGGVPGHVLAVDLALCGLSPAAVQGLSVLADADWPALLTQHRRVLSWP